MSSPADRDEAGSRPSRTDPDVDVAGSEPLRTGGPCPACGEEVEDLDFLELPAIAIKREMYDVCVIETADLPTPWRHPTAIAYHEDPNPFEFGRAHAGPQVD